MDLSRILDVFWPRRCESCGRPADRPSRHLCSECLMRVPFVALDGCCRVCSRPVEGYDGDFICDDCKDSPPFFDRAASAVRFEEPVRKMILDYKFNEHLYLRDDFVDWMEAAVRSRFESETIDAVLPMPLTLFHRLDRGYNQSAYLAKALAKRIDRQYLPNALKRIGSPRRQAELREDERRENVKDTVEVVRPDLVRGRTLLVTDDVMTTGSTLSECARVLKAAGASRVWCITLARSVRT